MDLNAALFDASLSHATVLIFAAVGFITTVLKLLKWLMKDVGRFIVFCRKWWRKYVVGPVDRPA
jgi:hypothetical protein